MYFSLMRYANCGSLNNPQWVKASTGAILGLESIMVSTLAFSVMFS